YFDQAVLRPLLRNHEMSECWQQFRKFTGMTRGGQEYNIAYILTPSLVHELLDLVPPNPKELNFQFGRNADVIVLWEQAVAAIKVYFIREGTLSRLVSKLRSLDQYSASPLKK